MVKRIPSKFTSAISHELKPNESIIWSTQPKPFHLVKKQIPAFLFSIPWNGFMFANFQQNLDFQTLDFVGDFFVIPFYFIGIFMFLLPIIEWYKSVNTLYVVTNRRAFTLISMFTTSIENFHSEKIEILDKLIRKDGSGDLVLMKSYAKDSDGDSQTNAQGFFSLPDVQLAEQYLEHLTKLNKKNKPSTIETVKVQTNLTASQTDLENVDDKIDNLFSRYEKTSNIRQEMLANDIIQLIELKEKSGRSLNSKETEFVEKKRQVHAEVDEELEYFNIRAIGIGAVILSFYFQANMLIKVFAFSILALTMAAPKIPFFQRFVVPKKKNQ